MEKLDQEECLEIWGHLVDLENLECLVKLADRALLERPGCPVKRAQMDQEDPQAKEDHRELKACQAWKAVRDPLVLMDQMDRLDHLDLMGLLGIEEFRVYQALLVQLEPQANKDHKEKGEILASQESKALRDHLGLLVLPGLLESEVSGVRRVHQESRELQGWAVDLVTRVHLVQRE